jgi:hypothetical protein
LSEAATLSCFGAYQEDVLGILMERVKNIRNFMKTGWDRFYGEALELKKII